MKVSVTRQISRGTCILRRCEELSSSMIRSANQEKLLRKSATATSRAASTAITNAARRLPAFSTDRCLTREQSSPGANEEKSVAAQKNRLAHNAGSSSHFFELRPSRVRFERQ